VGRILTASRADPLASLRLVPKQRAFLATLHAAPESALRAANKFGKSYVAAFAVIAMLRGLGVLAGVTLPRLRRDPAPVFWALTRTYKQQVEGTQAAVVAALGGWPHLVAWENRAEGIWASVRVRPDGWRDDRPETWAKLAFISQQNSRNDADIAKGQRLDGAWFDEPGYASVVRELRKAGRPGERFVMLHTFTPIKKREWVDIRADIEAPGSEISEVTASIYDAIRGEVENGFITRAEVTALEKRYALDPHRLARLQAIYCDVSGTCPFDLDALLEMRETCMPGERCAATWAPGTETLVLRPHPAGQVMRFSQPAAHDRLLVLCDPSSGVPPSEGQARDQAGLYAVSLARQEVLLRFAGYVTPPELGLMARAVCNGYRDWIFVPEMNGGWGEEVLRSFNAAPCAEGSSGVVYQDVDPTSTVGNAKTRVGWWQTATRRGALIAALQRAIMEQGLRVHSREAVENLMQVRLDEKDRYDQPGAPHALDMILLGMACSIMENGELMPSQARPRERTAREAFEQAMGVTLPGSENDGGLYPDEQQRWR